MTLGRLTKLVSQEDAVEQIYMNFSKKKKMVVG
jgi:hypothetical protein